MLNEQTVPLHVTIRVSQKERLIVYARHSGALNLSEAVRELLDRVLPPLPGTYNPSTINDPSFPAEEVGK